VLIILIHFPTLITKEPAGGYCHRRSNLGHLNELGNRPSTIWVVFNTLDAAPQLAGPNSCSKLPKYWRRALHSFEDNYTDIQIFKLFEKCSKKYIKLTIFQAK
jgi:hypothetical protein